jgi:protein-S-isoprenylcysteine O-methyltransferase Ste14
MRDQERHRRAAIGTALFTLTVPGAVVGLLPHLIARRRLGRPFTGRSASRWLGLALTAAGTPLVARSFVQFARAAGTPAPVYETESLVVSGPYRYMRNPQYVGIIAMLAGQTLIYGSRRVLAYSLCVALSFHLWVVRYEEPRLRRRFGQEYETYAARTPRWLWHWQVGQAGPLSSVRRPIDAHRD